jgi:hypothetical protein
MNEQTPSAAELSEAISRQLSDGLGLEVPPDQVEEAAKAISAWVAEDPDVLADLLDLPGLANPQLRISKTVFLPLSKAWQPLVVAAALAVAFVVSGGMAATGAVGLGGQILSLIRAFTRLGGEELLVCEAVCRVSAFRQTGATPTEIKVQLGDRMDAAAIIRRLESLRSKGVLKEQDAYWRPAL